MSQASRSGWAQAHQKRQEEMVWFNPVQTLYLNMGLICSKDNSFIQTFIISDYASLPEHLWVSLLDLSPSVAQHLETFCKSWSAVCWCTWNKFTSNALIDTLSPGSRVTIWCSFIVDGMAGLFDGILSVVRSTASASPGPWRVHVHLRCFVLCLWACLQSSTRLLQHHRVPPHHDWPLIVCTEFNTLCVGSGGSPAQGSGVPL